jgi:hypothetical protein
MVSEVGSLLNSRWHGKRRHFGELNRHHQDGASGCAEDVGLFPTALSISAAMGVACAFDSSNRAAMSQPARSDRKAGSTINAERKAKFTSSPDVRTMAGWAGAGARALTLAARTQKATATMGVWRCCATMDRDGNRRKAGR